MGNDFFKSTEELSFYKTITSMAINNHIGLTNMVDSSQTQPFI